MSDTLWLNHREIENCISFGRDDFGPDFGPYCLARGNGVPERGNFSCFILFRGTAAVYVKYDGDGFETRGNTESFLENLWYLRDGSGWDRFNELVNRLVHLTGLESLEARGHSVARASEIMELFWQCNGWEMSNCKIVPA